MFNSAIEHKKKYIKKGFAKSQKKQKKTIN